MPRSDGRIFQNSEEARASWFNYKAGNLKAGIEARLWEDLEEAKADLDPATVDQALGAHWDAIEHMPIDEGLRALADAALGKPPGQPKPGSLPAEYPELYAKDAKLSLSQIIKKRHLEREAVRKATEQEIFDKRRAEAPLEDARRQLRTVQRRGDQPAQPVAGKGQAA